VKKKLKNCFKKEGCNAVKAEKREEQEPGKKEQNHN